MVRIGRSSGRCGGLLLGSALAALLMPAMAAAQETPSPEVTPAQANADPQSQADDAAPPAGSDIIVTGSRVRGEAPVGSTVTTIGQRDLIQSGRVTIDRAIKDLPQVFDLGVSENSRAQSGGSSNIVYGNSINLRGIGPYATLVLVDGHRVTNNGRSTDPSILPTLGVQRIEVVADGASAIYGSDAIAGVVNLIPRRDLKGVEAFARAGVSDDGAYHEYSAGAAAGWVFDRGQLMVAYEHVEKSNLSGQDRAFFTSDQRRFGGQDYRVLRCDPGTIRATIGGASRSFAIPVGGVTPATAGSLVAGTSNRCDDLPGQDLIPSQKYDTVNGTFTVDITDWLTLLGDGFYSRRNFERLPGYPNATLTVPQTNAFFVRPAGFTGTSYALDYSFAAQVPRPLQFGFGQSWQVSPTLRFKLPHDWQIEALVSKGRTDDNSSQFGLVNNTALTAALASGNPATALDPYGLHRTSAAVLAGIYNQISVNPLHTDFMGYEARLNGELFRLPGGGVKLAAGYERQELDVAIGLARGNPGTAVSWRNFKRKVDSFYGELLIPLFGPDNELPGLRRLEIDAAVRHDRYDDVGKTTNPKIGVNWSPLPGLTARGSYGTSFRAPTISQIYGNTNQLFIQNFQNPTGGAPVIGATLSGGNLNLAPETAETWSAGADFEPIRNLRLSATYFSVDYKNQVLGLLSDLTVLARASQYAGTGLIVQGPEAGVIAQGYINQGLIVQGALPGGSASNLALFVDGRSQNLGRSITRGIDFSANYNLETDGLGDFAFNVGGTYLTKYTTQQSPAAPFLDQLNQIFQPMRLKLRTTVNWQDGPFGVFVRWTHLNAYDNTLITPVQRVSSYNPVDINLSFNAGDEAKPLRFGIELRNLLDEAPPYVNLTPSGNGSGGYDASAADPIGRLIAVSVRKSF